MSCELRAASLLLQFRRLEHCFLSTAKQHATNIVRTLREYQIDVDVWDPATRTTTTFAEVPAPPMGLAFDASGVLWMTGGTLREGPGYVWRVEPGGASGAQMTRSLSPW